MCALMIAGTPAAIAARNGGSSNRSSVARSASILGRPVCESVVVEPCPGKCFAQQKKPAAAYACTAALTSDDTRAGSLENERLLMIGFVGSSLTSATGAKFQLTPSARSSEALMVAAVRTLRSGSAVAASAIWPGRIVAPLLMRMTGPPSWSISKKRGNDFASRAIRPRSAMSFVRLVASAKFSE